MTAAVDLQTALQIGNQFGRAGRLRGDNGPRCGGHGVGDDRTHSRVALSCRRAQANITRVLKLRAPFQRESGAPDSRTRPS